MGAAANFLRVIRTVVLGSFLKNSDFSQYELNWGNSGVTFNGVNATFAKDGQIFQRIDGGTLPPGQYKLVITGTGSFHIFLSEGGLGPELPNQDFVLTGNTLEFNLVIGDVSHNLIPILTARTAGSVLESVNWVNR